MAATPTDAQIKAIRRDIEDYLPSGVTLADFATQALAATKRSLEDERGVRWGMVYDSTTGEYLTGYDDEARNDDRLKYAIAQKTVELILRDYAMRVEGGAWWDLANFYRDEFMLIIKAARLDIDKDESGDIDSTEDATLPTARLRR